MVKQTHSNGCHFTHACVYPRNSHRGRCFQHFALQPAFTAHEDATPPHGERVRWELNDVHCQFDSSPFTYHLVTHDNHPMRMMLMLRLISRSWRHHLGRLDATALTIIYMEIVRFQYFNRCGTCYPPHGFYITYLDPNHWDLGTMF